MEEPPRGWDWPVLGAGVLIAVLLAVASFALDSVSTNTFADCLDNRAFSDPIGVCDNAGHRAGLLSNLGFGLAGIAFIAAIVASRYRGSPLHRAWRHAVFERSIEQYRTDSA